MMAKSENQKLKLLYIVKILHEKTDEQHFLSTKNLIEELEKVGIKAERKSIYDDIERLAEFGYVILKNGSKTEGGYYLAEREFELPELKLLVDVVQASKFITVKKSGQLIKKLESLTSVYQAKQLQRQVFVANRIKTSNESIYYNVDDIHRAIQENDQIQFKYFEYSVKKEMIFRKEGQSYEISPWAVTWSQENYYLIGFDELENRIKHYRIDKMKEIRILTKKRQANEELQHFDLAAYSNQTFGMYGGEEMDITIQCPNRLAGVMIDRFGKEVTIRERNENLFSVRVKVALSGQFFGWLTGLGSEAVIISPPKVVDEYKQYLQTILKQYEPK